MALIIETKMVEDSDGSYEGSYRLDYYGPIAPGTDDSGRIEATGKVSCGMD